MATAWNGCTIFCGGKDGCGSEDISYVDDESCGSCDDYAVYRCNNCGKIIRIELPN